jgi:hypothetical protein
MALETVYSCPFGHVCETVKDNKIHRCVLYLEMKTKNNISNEEKGVWNCAMNWNVILQHETNSRVFGVQQATEDFSNEMVKTNQQSIGLLLANSPQLRLTE